MAREPSEKVYWKMLGTQEADLYVDTLIIEWYHMKRGRVIGDGPKWSEDVIADHWFL